MITSTIIIFVIFVIFIILLITNTLFTYLFSQIFHIWGFLGIFLRLIYFFITETRSFFLAKTGFFKLTFRKHRKWWSVTFITKLSWNFLCQMTLFWGLSTNWLLGRLFIKNLINGYIFNTKYLLLFLRLNLLLYITNIFLDDFNLWQF